MPAMTYPLPDDCPLTIDAVDAAIQCLEAMTHTCPSLGSLADLLGRDPDVVAGVLVAHRAQQALRRARLVSGN